jgi:hypothetical protein
MRSHHITSHHITSHYSSNSRAYRAFGGLLKRDSVLDVPAVGAKRAHQTAGARPQPQLPVGAAGQQQTVVPHEVHPAGSSSKQAKENEFVANVGNMGCVELWLQA